MSPTAAMMRDSKAEVENPWRIRAARRVLYDPEDASPTAIPTMAIIVDRRKTGRLPYLREKPHAKGLARCQ